MAVDLLDPGGQQGVLTGLSFVGLLLSIQGGRKLAKQATDRITLVNVYAAYARKLKLEISEQLKLFDDLAQNFADLPAKSTYKSSLFESDGPVDEDVLRQFEKEVKDRVKIARLLVAESKENYDNQLKIQKLKDTIFAVNELLIKARKNGGIAGTIAAKSVPKSLHCLAMRLMEERISHPENYAEEEPEPEFEDVTLYHYALFSDNVVAVSVVIDYVVKNAEDPSIRRMEVEAQKRGSGEISSAANMEYGIGCKKMRIMVDMAEESLELDGVGVEFPDPIMG